GATNAFGWGFGGGGTRIASRFGDSSGRTAFNSGAGVHTNWVRFGAFLDDATICCRARTSAFKDFVLRRARGGATLGRALLNLYQTSFCSLPSNACLYSDLPGSGSFSATVGACISAMNAAIWPAAEIPSAENGWYTCC